MFPLYKKDGSLVNFETEAGRDKTLKAFPNKYSKVISRVDPVDPVDLEKTKELIKRRG